MWEFLGGSKPSRHLSPPRVQAVLNEQRSEPSPLLPASNGSPQRQGDREFSEPLVKLPHTGSSDSLASSTLTEARSPPLAPLEADEAADVVHESLPSMNLRQAGSMPLPAHGGPSTSLRAQSMSAASPMSSMTSLASKRHVHKRLSKLLAATVNFRDVSFVTREEQDPTCISEEEGQYATLSTGISKNKLIIIMVGLPARGKTFLCNKLMRYLNWLGHETHHFNVGQYRRKHKGEETQDAMFFDHSNEAGLEARNRALNAALEDLESWLMLENSQVAILDATNSTVERRQYLRQRFHGKWSYLCVESVCNDEEVLMDNYLNKMRFSPDYTGVDTEKALQDFVDRIKKYEEVYVPVSVDRSFHYIQLNNMITGRAHLDVNRISGFIQGKIVFFLMQVCKAGVSSSRKIWLTRHGQSEYNKSERLGGDSCLSEAGERYAALLPNLLLSRLPQEQQMAPLSVWTSTLKRTILTARFMPFPKLQWKSIDEINAGACDGMTYKEIEQQMPEEFAARKRDKLRYRYPEGESYLDVIQRLEPVITEVERERECVCIVSHQAVLRVVYGYFMGIPQEQIPNLKIPLHTLIELTPLPDGTMAEERYEVDINRGPEQFTDLAVPLPAVLAPAPASAVTAPPHKAGVEQQEAGRPGSPESATSCTIPMNSL